MEIKTIVVGPLQTNCYILTKNNQTLIIDPGDEPNKIINEINKEVIGILITHYHFDHIGALNTIKEKYNYPVYDISNLKEDINTIGPFSFKVIKTPGHKSDLVSYLFDKNLFCGDFIFKGSIGRYDLPSGNFQEMQKSISQIIKYDQDIIIYPGHGPKTTLKEEINNLISYL